MVQGANGAGKTSLLRIVLGLAPPAHGEVTWDGAPIRSLGETYRRAVLYCGHTNALKDDLSAVENLRTAAALAGHAITRAQALGALARSGVERAADLPVRNLSQGQKRRAALARLALSREKLWVLDEPLAALDTEGTQWLGEMLDAHLAAGGMALVTSHQPLTARAPLAAVRIGA
jgi:heme exporter protein A